MAKKELGPDALALVQAVRALPEAPLVVACSGGPDSLALAAAVAHTGRAARAVVVDHGLQAAATDAARRARAQLEPRGLPVDIVAVSVPTTGAGPEADARAARHEALDAHTPPGHLLVLAHTRDDQAEQVLLGLARGSGTRALAGMPAARDLPGGGRLVRPILHLGRATTEAACEQWGLKPWHDPHNDDPRFTRVRVRRGVLPALTDHLGPGVVDALARTAAQARQDADLLDALAAERLTALTGDASRAAPDALPVAALDAPPALATRVLRRWLIDRGAVEPGHAHVHEVLRLVTDWHGQHSVTVPGLRVGRRQDHLVAMPH